MVNGEGDVMVLAPPRYSQQEKSLLLGYVMALKADRIREFLAEHDEPTSGAKSDLRERIAECLDAETLGFEDLVGLLDSVASWGKQHVYLYAGPAQSVAAWRGRAHVDRLLKKRGVAKLLNARLPLALPKEPTLSSIEYREGRSLRVVAVERREYYERREDMDDKKELDGRVVEMRAFLSEVTRGMAIFEWNLVSNEAEMRITQLPSGSDYESVEQSLAGLVRPWLDLSPFAKLDIRAAIGRLHDLERQGHPEARSHEIGYKTLGGRTISAQSPTSNVSVFGETDVDTAMDSVHGHGVGHTGNFYWLGSDASQAHGNPLQREVHTMLVGSKSRINFTAPNRQQDVRHVLSRVRALSH